jgi:hypothetical protein
MGRSSSEGLLVTTLDAILDEANDDASILNTTVLDTKEFYTIRAPSSPTFRMRIDAAILVSDDLIKVQQINAEEGLEVIEPVRAGIRGGFWYLRNLTHRGETFPAGERQYSSIVEALEAAIDWWHIETWCRGIMVRKYNANHADGPS